MVCAMSFWKSQSIYIYKLINARGLSHSLTLFSFFFFFFFLSYMIIFGKLLFSSILFKVFRDNIIGIFKKK